MTRRDLMAALLIGLYAVVPKTAASVKALEGICTFPNYSQTASNSPACGPFAVPGEDKTYWRDYDVYVQLICPGGSPQDTWDHQTIRTEAVGECCVQNYPDVECKPTFGTPVSSQSPIVSGKHQWTQAVTNKECFVLWPLPWFCYDGDSDTFTALRGPAADCNDSQYCPQPCGGQEQEIEWCNAGESTWWDYDNCQCVTSPVVIDLSGNGYSLTNRINGVHFDLDQDGTPELIPWTSNRSDDAWLTLDKNGNGTVDDGSELFGNFSPQPASATPNGFAALGIFDLNADGWIDKSDSVYADLRLWTDTNRDGVSQPTELSELISVGLRRISTSFEESRRRDRWGNLFRYRARVVFRGNRDLPRFAWDVFFPVDVPVFGQR